MKCVQSNKLDFSGQNIYVGIDVHLKSWSVAILSDHSVLKRFSQSPEPEALHKYLVINYPGANYFSVYEAGFCGFWIHERLTDLGITNTLAILPLKGEAFEKESIIRALKACNGHREQAAGMLNINPATLYRKMKKYGLK
jgi:transcriptional regulator of acetoin/glycerol metabolism